MNLVQIAIRLHATTLERAQSMIPILAGDPTLAFMGRMTRAKVLRLALSRGLDALEAEFGTAKADRPPTRRSGWSMEED